MACKFYVDGKSVSEREFKKRIIDELKENKIDLSQVFTEPIKTGIEKELDAEIEKFLKEQEEVVENEPAKEELPKEEPKIEEKSLKDKYDTSKKFTNTSDLKKGDYAAVKAKNGIVYEGEVTGVGTKNIKIKTQSEMYGESELQFPKDNVEAFYKPKTERIVEPNKTIGEKQYKLSPSLTSKDITITPLTREESKLFEHQLHNVKNDFEYLRGGWYLVGENNYGDKTYYNDATKEAVEIKSKKGGRMGIIEHDFLKNNSRFNDDIVVRGSKYKAEEHNPPFGGSGHYKGTYFYEGYDAERKAKEHGENLSKADISNANLYEIKDNEHADQLKREAKKQGFHTTQGSGYGESEYLKSQGYDGIRRGNEIILFDAKKFEPKQKLSDKIRSLADDIEKKGSSGMALSAPIPTIPPKVVKKILYFIADAIDAGVSVTEAFGKGLRELRKELGRNVTREETEFFQKEVLDKFVNNKTEPNAIQEPSAESLHGSAQEATTSQRGEPSGVGTSKQGEGATKKSSQEGVRVRNIDTQVLREKLGLPQIEKEARKTNEQVWDAVKAKGDLEIRNIVNTIAESQTPSVTVENQAAILLDRVRIANEYNDIQEGLSKAYEAKDKGAITDLLVREAQLEKDRDINDIANTKLGSEWGGVGNFRQGVSNLEYTYDNVVREFKNANLGHITKEEAKFFKEKIDFLKQKAEDAERIAKEKEQEVEKLRGEYYKEFMADYLKNNKPKKYTQNLKVVADNFRKTLKTKRDWVDADGNPLQIFKSGIDWNDLVEIGAKAIEKTGELLDGIKAIMDKLSTYAEFRALSDRDKKAVREQVIDLLSKSSNKQLEPYSDLVDRLINKADGTFNQKELQHILAKILRVSVEEGATTMDEVVKRLQKEIDGRLEVSDEDLGDALSGYGMYKKLPKGRIETQIRKIKALSRADAAIRDITERKQLPKRTGFERDVADVEVRAKRKEVIAALKESGLEPELTQAELEAQYKSDLEAYHTRLSNAIEDIEKELASDKKMAKAKSKIYNDEKSVSLKERLQELRKLRDEKFPKEPMSDEKRAEIVVKRLESSIDEINADIAILERDDELQPKDKKSPITNAKIEELRKMKQTLLDIKESLIPEDIKIEAKYNKWKESRVKVLKKLEEKLANKDFEPKFAHKFSTSPLDREGQLVNYQIIKTRNEIKKKIEEAKIKQRGKYEQTLDALPAIKKFMIFAGATIYPKLASAAALMQVFNTARKPIQYGLSQLPIIKKIAEKAPVEGYAGMKSGGEKLASNIAESWSRLVHKETIEEAKKAFLNEQRYIDKYEKQYKEVDKSLIDKAARFLIHSHKGIKNFPEQAEYWAAHKNATKWAIDNGLNPRDIIIQDLIHSLAKDASLNTILMNKTAASTLWKGTLGQLKNMGNDTTAKGKATRRMGKALASFLETEVPVVGVPINTINEAISYLGGGFKAAAMTKFGSDKAIRELTNADADHVLKLLGKQSIGLLTLGLTIWLHKYFGGLYHKGKRDEDNLKEGEIGTSEHSLPALFLHHPAIYADMIVADYLNQIEEHPKDGAINTLLGSINAVSNTIPYLDAINRTGEAFKNTRSLQRFGADIVEGLTTPMFVREAAKYMDRDKNGDVIHRYPQNFLQDVATNIPIARQTVPSDYSYEQEKRKEQGRIKTPEEKANTEKKETQNRIDRTQREITNLKKHLDEYSDYIGIKLPKATHISKVDIKGKTKDQVYNLKNTILKSYQKQLEIDKARLQSMK